MPTRHLRLDALEDRTVPFVYDPVTGIGFDAQGREFVVDHELADPAHPPPDDAARGPALLEGTPFELHSRPGASRVIYLDFTGHTTAGTAWNRQGPPTIVTPAYSTDSDPGFNATELQRVRGIWSRVAEDFSPFNVDVTTEDPGLADLVNSGGTDSRWGIRVIIGGNGDWIGRPGGVAYVGSFGWGTDTGCFVFSQNLAGGSEKAVTEAASHEVGHTLGLRHDGRTSPPEGYYWGHGSGDTGWAPLMGVGYDRELTQWSRGEYTGANNTEDDLAIIARPAINFGFRPDDAGSSVDAATPFPDTGTALDFAGAIERPTDVDVLRFTAGGGPATFRVQNHAIEPNLDVRAEIWDAAGNLLAAANPPDLTDATVTFDLPVTGVYHLAVRGVGKGSPLAGGYSDYGSLGQYMVTGTVTAPTLLGGLEATALNYLENNPGLPLTSTLAVNSALPIASASVAISSGYVPGQDTLFFSNVGGAIGTFDPAAGVLTFGGTGTAADYTAALRGVRYFNPSDDPAGGGRRFTFRLTNTAGGEAPPVSRGMTVTPVNDAPTVDPMADVGVNEDAGRVAVDLAGITAGGEAQAVTVTATSSNPTRVPHPAVSYAGGATGTLTFAPVADRSGAATITVTVKDPGGTANGGVDTVVRQFVVAVQPINDAPVLVGGGDPFAPLDAGPQQLVDWAATVSAGPPDEAAQALTVLIDNDNPSLFGAQPALARDGTLTFTPAPGATGVATVTARLQDDGGTALGGADTSDPITFLIFVGVNRAPKLDPTAEAELDHIGAGAADPHGTPVAALLAGHSDPDPDDLRGVAVTGLTEAASGRWEFSTDDGDTWQDLEAASPADARLLTADDRVRFVPDPGYTGRPTLSFHGWDGTAGLPGGTAPVGVPDVTSAFSADADTALLRVAPVVGHFNEDARTRGLPVGTFTAGRVTDPDPRARSGVAVVGAGGELPGAWQFSTNGGVNWRPLTADRGRARLLRDGDRVRFLPARDATGDAFLKVVAWDQSAGTAGTTADLRPPTALGGQSPFSTASDYLVVRITPVNDRPAPDAKVATTLTPVDPVTPTGAGDRVGTLLGATVIDVDAVADPGLAVTRVSKGGAWQFQLGGTGPWEPVPAVSAREALLLGPDDRIRFVPDPGFVGLATFGYKAWDRTTAPAAGSLANTAEGTAFSTAVKVAKVTVGAGTVPPVNRSPVLDPAMVPALAGVAEGTKPTGTPVAGLLGSAMTDPDATAFRGIAVTRVTGAGGSWQYSATGRTWRPFGPVSRGRALLLRDTDHVRFLPGPDWSGPATVTFHAWDQTRGTAGRHANLVPAGTTGGDAPFSATNATARLSVTPTNDAPVLAVRPGVTLTAIGPTETDSVGNAVADLIGHRISDVDPGTVAGVGVTAVRNGNGGWEYSRDGGATWNVLSPPKPGFALLLRAQDRVRFVPWPGPRVPAAISYRAWDRTAGHPGTWVALAGQSSLGRAAETATIAVTSQNVRPVLDITPNIQLDPVVVGDDDPPGTEVSRLLLGATDPNAGAVTGIAVTRATGAGGEWQFTTDGGAIWEPIGFATAGSAVLLGRTDRVRFVPAAGFTGQAKLSFKAWDQSADGAGLAGRWAATSTTSFSTATETAIVLVNTAPALA